MLKIDKKLIENISNLAKLELTDSEKEKYLEDFKEILKSFEILNEISVEKTESSFRPVEEKNALRKDEETECLTQSAALKFTKDQKEGFFIGPKTTE